MALVVCILLYMIFLGDRCFGQDFEIPEATVQLLYPVGFTVSIPDRSGIRLFAFHGKVNEEFTSPQDGGRYSRDITRAKNGKWTYTDKTTRFKKGDEINYWLYVDYDNGRNQLGYMSEFRKFVVRECPRQLMNEKGDCTASDPYHYEVPEPSIEILTPRGFKVSIPDQDGVKLFAFHGKINESFDGREAGSFSRDITKARDGRWTFTDRVTLLNPGDIIYYWLYVDYEDPSGRKLGYLKEDQEYTVGGVSSCMKSLTTWNGEVACSAQLLLDEQFNRFNTVNWTNDIRYADDPDFEFVIYDKHENNLNVRDGQLHIRPTLADERYGSEFIYSKTGYDLGSSCTADVANDCKRTSVGGYTLPPIFSGRIVSTNFFKYGRVEVRAKLPKGDWIYPQILLSPKEYEYGKTNYDSGEIRIAFLGGNAHLMNELQGRILLGTSVSTRNYGITKTTGNDWSNDYHLFSVIWNPESISFFVDDREYGQIIPPRNGFSSVVARDKPEAASRLKRGTLLAPFDKDMVIKIGVGVGGHTFPDSIPNKPYTNEEQKPQLKFYKAKDSWMPTWTRESELIVDYVKVYAL
ncbi:Carbohydrate binding domain (family 32) [Popillia japonica]|uniref:Carbohydrate binding domain (Family 32) n=1 Tax=Popillia japonica TaxID=7064 RepID=A0AAW1IWW7_POPJA